MKNSFPSVSARLTPLAVLSLALALLSSCGLVHVKDAPSEASWMDEIVHDNHAAPASFHHGEADYELGGFLWSHEGRLKMNFYCESDELAEYAGSVRERVLRKIAEEGYTVVSEREIADREWEYEYARNRDRGRVTMEIVARDGKNGYPYRLELRWTED
jgi:hypothetical protein